MSLNIDSSRNSNLMTKPQVAEKLQVSEVTVWRYCTREENALPYVKLGNSIRFRQEDVDAFIAANLVSGSQNKERA